MNNDETIDRIGRELMAAIEAALAADSRVQGCLERARSAGLEFRVALNRAAQEVVGARAPAGYSVTESDRRFLRSLRIAVDETARQG